MTTASIYPYNRKSKGARALAEALGLTDGITPERIAGRIVSHYENTQKKFPFLINWGSGQLPTAVKYVGRVFNKSKAVNIARNKTRFFEVCSAAADGPRVPEFTNDPEKALGWVKDGLLVLGRQNTGSCGKDITFFEDDPEGFANSVLWVLYKKKKHEFRVHLIGEKVILIQKKVLPSVDPDGNPIPKKEVDFRIRNHRNGFIFQRHDVDCPGDVVNQAHKALKATGLDFGAVDVIWNEHEGKAYVLEINTAPGLEGSTVEDYRKAFAEALALA